MNFFAIVYEQTPTNVENLIINIENHTVGFEYRFVENDIWEVEGVQEMLALRKEVIDIIMVGIELNKAWIAFS